MSSEALSDFRYSSSWWIAVELSHVVNVGPLPFKVFTHIAFWLKSSTCAGWALIEAVVRGAIGALLYSVQPLVPETLALHTWKEYFFKGAATSLVAYLFFQANTLTFTFASHVLKDVCPSRIEAFFIESRVASQRFS